MVQIMIKLIQISTRIVLVNRLCLWEMLVICGEEVGMKPSEHMSDRESVKVSALRSRLSILPPLTRLHCAHTSN